MKRWFFILLPETSRCIIEFLLNFHLMPTIYIKQQSEKEIRGDLFNLKEDTNGVCVGNKDSVSLEIVILSEVGQTENDKYHVISLICGI